MDKQIAEKVAAHIASYIEQTTPLNFGGKPVRHIAEIVESALKAERERILKIVKEYEREYRDTDCGSAFIALEFAIREGE